MCYADDILAIGPKGSTDWFYSEVKMKLLVRQTSELTTKGSEVPFLGRLLKRDGKGIHMMAPKSYVNEMMEVLGLENAKKVGTTRTATSTNK